MDEYTRIQQIKRILNASVEHLSPAVTQRLAHARQMALKHARVRAPAHAIKKPTWMQSLSFHPQQLLKAFQLPIATLSLATSVGLGLWFNYDPIHEIADLDTQLLTDALPPNAYLPGNVKPWPEHPAIAKPSRASLS